MELVRGKSGRIKGGLVTFLTVCRGLPHAYNRDLQVGDEIASMLMEEYRQQVQVVVQEKGKTIIFSFHFPVVAFVTETWTAVILQVFLYHFEQLGLLDNASCTAGDFFWLMC
ncbi:hypothetical protein KIW84_022926 [Lathyrus oleraceus]|uniref:Uncharacterized protein n=1 Tax=Pisum sativum TaxID=3888 RepID=A0A9D4YG32_PEA|nr:hypothetical protein KIW84_022926 [Pisum sativum]